MAEVKLPFDVPGASKPASAPSATPTAEAKNVAEEAKPTAASQAETATQEKPKRKVTRKATRVITPEDIQFVMANVKKMTYTEMADKLGLTRHQVNRILMDIKKQLREEAKKTGKVEEVERFIKEHLSRPEDSRPGGNKGGGAVKNAINDTVADILSKL